MPIVECGKFQLKRLLSKLKTSGVDTPDAKPKVRYTVKHVIHNDVVRVLIHDHKEGSCAVKASKKSNIFTGASFASSFYNEQMFIDVDEPTEKEKANGVTMESRIAKAYKDLQATADEMNYQTQKPIRIAQAVKNFEEHKDIIIQETVVSTQEIQGDTADT